MIPAILSTVGGMTGQHGAIVMEQPECGPEIPDKRQNVADIHVKVYQSKLKNAVILWTVHLAIIHIGDNVLMAQGPDLV